MYTYMEYLQKCFNTATNWNEDNIFSHLSATLQALIDFPIPNGAKVDVSLQLTLYSASLFTLSSYRAITGSIAYFYLSSPLYSTKGSKDLFLQDAIAGFKVIEPVKPEGDSINGPPWPMLLYGRMYFPGLALEAMMIKRISANTQLLMKCISNPFVDGNGTMIVYLQTNKQRYLREFIFSTNEALLGTRFVYNLAEPQTNGRVMPKFDNSVISLGTEVWYAAKTLSPGLSAALRYLTRLTLTGKPLTMTVAVNPILGHIQLTYTVKTSVALTFCSKYDFNMYSYALNLSLGCELYLSSSAMAPPPARVQFPHLLPGQVTQNSVFINPIEAEDDTFYINPNLIDQPMLVEDAMEKFATMVNELKFRLVVKCSTSLSERTIKLLWEGHLGEFLVSLGFKMAVRENKPEILRFGITFSYAA